MVIPKINSAHGSDTRNVLNRAIDLINLQGKSIQDLVAKGQLTPSQYATLIQTVNGLISKGDVAFDDIDINKGKLLPKHLSEEVLKMLTGDAPVNAVPADGSLTTEKFAPKAITPEKTDFMDKIIKSVNLFNKNSSDIEKGKYITPDGVISTNESYALTGYIEVEPNTDYRTNATDTLNVSGFYDANKQLINTGTLFEFTTPANAKYVRLHMFQAQMDSFMFYKYDGETLSYIPYEEDFLLKKEIKINDSNIENESINIDKLNIYTKLPGKNLFNKQSADLILGSYINGGGGIANNELYALTGYIEVKPNTAYRTNATDTLDVSALYDKDKNYIGRGFLFTPTTTDNTKYIRLNMMRSQIETFMFYEYEGQALDYIPYEENSLLNNDIKISAKNIVTTLEDELSSYNRIYNLSDSINAWKSGLKFPIAFLGDSTTDGVGTTTHPDTSYNNVIGTNHISPNAYPKLLENKLKTFTGNNLLRVYNAGFAGKTTNFAAENMNDIFLNNPHYADVKMIGIMYGINDRSMNIETFKQNLKGITLWCYKNGIQPFIVTPQTILQGYSDLDSIQTSLQLTTVICRVLKEFADEYNLEIIDMNKVTSHFLDYSSVGIDSIIGDTLHFSDAGHKFEADYLFSVLAGRTLYIRGGKNITVTNPYVKRSYARNQTFSKPDTFKRYVPYTNTTTDTLINEAYVFNLSEGVLNLSVDVSAPSNFYFKTNGISYTTDDLVSLDIGLHKIEIYSGVDTTGEYYGFNLGKE